ncbi:MAG: hypothetical protein ABIP20_00915 [Chthoniobacteraceae bacterium]
MKTNILTTAILALTGFALSTQSAHAVGGATTSYGDNDLILGFRTTVAPGQTNNLEVNLGNADSFYNPIGAGLLTGPAITNIGRLSLTDLQTFGSGSAWSTRSDLFWGIAGTSNTSGSFDGLFNTNTIYLSRAETTAGVQTTPWNRQNNFNAANTQIASLGGGYTGLTSTATSDYDVFKAAADVNSYKSRSGGQPGQTFGAVNGNFANDSAVATFGTGTWISVQDMYALQQGGTGAGTYIGSFGLRADGTLDYAASASAFAPTPVPEPGTAAFGVAAFIATALRRRRGNATLAA